ncbi:MAG: class I SAM-dependent methyltransferase [Thaumarchaeota archaeon]|nr:class I SAM-dependent methyltransferase [Nitrososphaerota archaeon]
MACQVCGYKRLQEVIDLGHHPPSDAFLRPYELEESEILYPLRVLHCPRCHLVQLSYAVDPRILFGDKYVYLTGMNASLTKHLQEIPAELVKRFSIKKGSLVIDIGSNDGTLLEGYKSFGMRLVGVEPSDVGKNSAKPIQVVKDFFSEETARMMLSKYGSAQAITATNVFPHVKDLEGFMKGVRLLLAEGGVFLAESHYLRDMIEQLQYVEIYHEHLRYYSLTALVYLFSRFGMEVIDAKRIPTHGGSLQYIACKEGNYVASPSVARILKEEIDCKLHNMRTFQAFSKQVYATRTELMGLLWSLKRNGARIAGMPAPAKGNTLLNFCRIGPELVDYLGEKNPFKIGRYSPGTHVRVAPESELLDDEPDYVLLLSWDIKEVLIRNLRKNGYSGKIIVPVPKPVIVDA